MSWKTSTTLFPKVWCQIRCFQMVFLNILVVWELQGALDSGRGHRTMADPLDKGPEACTRLVAVSPTSNQMQSLTMHASPDILGRLGEPSTLPVERPDTWDLVGAWDTKRQGALKVCMVVCMVDEPILLGWSHGIDLHATVPRQSAWSRPPVAGEMSKALTGGLRWLNDYKVNIMNLFVEAFKPTPSRLPRYLVSIPVIRSWRVRSPTYDGLTPSFYVIRCILRHWLK
ncbi:hypothetical protein BDR05DRAFT_953697 [Suillus weaverae]|nr:hypothetical protein BDR05DRAFT_953697 [Suillus weaverae]